MADETGQVATADATVVADAPIAAPVSIIGQDGKFTATWRDSLPEDIRSEKSLQSFQDVQGLAKSLVSAQRMVGKNKAAIPGDTSTQVEWDEFYKAGGRPETAADYGLKRPDDLPEQYYDSGRVKEVQELAHKIGLSKKQLDTLFAWNNANVAAGLKSIEQNRTLELQTLQDALHAEWGQAYNQKVHLGNLAIEQGVNGDEAFKARVAERFGNDPDIVRLLANLGGKFAESGVVKNAQIPTPGNIKSEIDDLMQTDAYMNGRHPGHQAAVDKVQRMFVEMRK